MTASIRTLFNHWFLEFAPFADEQFIDSEIGLMPSSIQLVPLKNLTKTITKGTTPTTLGYKYTERGVNFIKGESILDDHSFDFDKFAHIDDETNAALKRSIIEDRDLLFTIAGTLGRFAMAVSDVLPANTNQAIGIIRANSEKIAPEVLLSYFLGGWQNDYYSRRVQQAVQANLSLTTLKSLPVPVLNGKRRHEYESLIIPMVHAIEANNAQSRKLADLRNALLPKLMSGEIDVSQVELPTLPNNHLSPARLILLMLSFFCMATQSFKGIAVDCTVQERRLVVRAKSHCGIIVNLFLNGFCEWFRCWRRMRMLTLSPCIIGAAADG